MMLSLRSRVLETRTTTHGMIRRRRKRSDGIEFQTVEVPIEVWTEVSKNQRGNSRIEGWLVTMQRKVTYAKAEQMLAAGKTIPEISTALDIPERTLWRVRTEWIERSGGRYERVRERKARQRTDAEKMFTNDVRIAAVAKAVGVNKSTVYRWLEAWQKRNG